MKLLVVTFSGLLLLSGCSSSTASNEHAIKLLEYEKCLEMQQGLFAEQNRIANGGLFVVADPDTETGRILFFDGFFLKNCSAYRP
jgi:hypothetical protein